MSAQVSAILLLYFEMNFKFFRKKTELDLQTLNKFHANSNLLDNSK